MKKDNWTSEFRERMDSYTVTPPNDVWEKLDKELSSTPATKIRIFSFTAIAAIIILLLQIINLIKIFLKFYQKAFQLKIIPIIAMTI